MAKTTLEQWDATAANNTDIGGIAVTDSTAPASLDNIVREQMSQTKSALATRAGDVASATTTDLDASEGLLSGAITGTTTITGVTLTDGRTRIRTCSGALPITAAAGLVVLGTTSGTTSTSQSIRFIWCSTTIIFSTTRFSWTTVWSSRISNWIV